ncbi:MAG: hypothetical protein HQK49_15175 [Oligoflexia bacterium]|nr:hypothetical protein [Oligoflexia bacterium]
MKILLTINNRVLDITFDTPLGYFDAHYSTSYNDSKWNHKVLAKQINDKELASIIVFEDYLRKDLLDNQKFCKQETVIEINRLTEEAQKQIKLFPSTDEIEELFKKNELILHKGNYHKDEDHRTHKSTLLDSYYEGLLDLEKAKVVFDYKESCKWYFNEETEEEREATAEEEEAQWIKIQEELIMPRTSTKVERIYDLPECLAHWDDRNNFQQYFFVKQDTGWEYISGGYGSSGSRYNLGIMIHAFAHLQKQKQKQKKNIPTWVLEYNNCNETILRDHTDTFRCVAPHFGSNYHNDDRDETERLTKSLIVHRGDYVKERDWSSD